ncbi:MAG TPA: 50S ribosomal protein L10 [Cryomorphaceae bacterium]|nr:50S ribosomal protein L10 [Cryomorphaceae bacterium]
MTREEKLIQIEELTAVLNQAPTIYLADIAALDADTSSSLRRASFGKGIKLNVVKNTLLRKAMEASEKDFEGLYGVLKGNTSIMLSDAGNAPAKLIKEFRKKSDKPVLKGAWIEESVYLGDENLEMLTSIKSKEELIGEVITLLQSPAKNVVSALQSSGSTLASLLKTLEERNA